MRITLPFDLTRITLPTLAALLGFSILPRADAASVRVEIPWERSWPVATPAGAASFGFRVSNTDAAPADVRFTARLTPPSGATEDVTRDLHLAAGETQTIPWPLTGREMGVWTIDYSAVPQADARAAVKRKVSFAYLEPAGPNETKPAFRFGVVAHTERVSQAESDRELEAAAFVGCKVMRTGSEWGRIQPEPGQWKWESMDRLVDKAASLGMEIQVLLAYTPKWTAPAAAQASADWLDWNRAMPDTAAWREFVSTYARRYQGRIHLWETWNEPDLEGFWRGTTEDYITLLTISRDELRKADPANVVMSGGFATLQSHPSRKKNPDLQQRAMTALGATLDAHAIHEHGPFDRFQQVVDGPYAQMRAALPQPVPPMFFNETADHSMYGTEKEQAATLVKKAAFAQARGAIGYLWYDLRNDGVDPGDPEHNFGLLTKSLEPKPAYAAFNTMARYVVPRAFLQQLDAGPNRWFLLFGGEREKLLVYWNDDPGTQNEQILLSLPGAARASLIDINGNASPLPLSGGLAVVTSSREPRLILAENASAITPAGLLAGPRRAFFGGPGDEIEISCDFSNPTAAPVTVQTKWTLPTTMRLVKEAPESVEIPASGRASSTVTVRLPEGAQYLFGRSAKVKLAYEFAGQPYRGSLLVPVHYGTISVPPGPAANRTPDVTLDQRDQLTSFIEADPHMTPYRWKGPEDLSAKVAFQLDENDLVVRVAVTDDKHRQPGPAGDMWMADSVQCLIAVPGQKGAWELGFAQTDDGQPLVAAWAAPTGAPDIREKIRLTVETQGEGRVYTARIPREPLGLDDRAAREGVRLNLAVNDNDGAVRAHALQIAPGIVANKSADSAPYLVFQPSAPKTP